MNKQTQTRNKDINKQKFQVEEQYNFSLILSSGVTPPASHPGVGI
jgi:hypothetical protein